ncbi:hypothetical protein PGT21_025973 [Puccinia graminis f. sp. tritici]|uniref:Uncharacterized protein n=1 Tax=Puccinia graminis f. sp. tritici TaxID=56615 RepID=A0A5B0M7P3_PUCGR|nr:hypothetical protein PGTUg99_027648 [Puccinia graminis f. sp. tritici]KAA1072020.1 hypothetical protein PGT21_025973 [Puccinia graminis f. sp. tritici]
MQRKARSTPHHTTPTGLIGRLNEAWWDGRMPSQEYFFPILFRLYRKAKARMWKSAFILQKRWAMKWRMDGHRDPGFNRSGNRKKDVPDVPCKPCGTHLKP